MKMGKTKEEILARVKEIKAIQNTKDTVEQGKLEMELDILWVEYKDLEDPSWSKNNPWTKHSW